MFPLVRPFAALMFVAGLLSAQPVCWRARPLDQCRSWIVTEAAVEMTIASTSANHTFGGYSSYVSDDIPSRVAFTFGSMWNRTPSTALGFTGTLSMADPDGLLPNRIEARYRKWFAEKSGADLSLGIARQTIRGDDELRFIRTTGLTAGAGVTNTYFGIDGRVDLLYGDGRPIVGALVGIRSGSRAAPIVTVSALGALFALLAMLGPID